MPLAMLEQKLRSLPEQSFSEVDGFFDYILYKFGTAQKKENKLSTEEARKLFDQFSGSIDREIDYKKERERVRNLFIQDYNFDACEKTYQFMKEHLLTGRRMVKE